MHEGIAMEESLALSQRVQEARLAARTPAVMRLQNISEIVIGELVGSATLIRSPSFRFLFDKLSKRVYRIGDNREFRSFLNEKFGINREFEYILVDIDREVEYRGTAAEVHRFAFYDKERNLLFVDRRNGEILMLNGDTVRIVPNGTDGFFFLSPEKAEPIEWEEVGPELCYFCDKGFPLGAPEWVQESALLKALTDGLKFVGPLTPDEQRGLLLLIVYLTFFESINPTKPVTVATGAKGSGKTDLGRNIGRILIGRQFNVTRFRNDERDFATTCANNYLVVVDNLEEKAKWLLDLIAIIATGGEISMRELHTTCSEVKLRLKLFLFLNAIDPKLRRDDIADRLLIFQLDRLEAFKSEADIETGIERSLPRIWGELLMNLNGILRRLKNGEAVPPGRFRLQDFEVFAKRICSSPTDVEAVLEKMENLRGEYSLSNDNLCLFLDKWLDGEVAINGALLQPNLGREVIAKELLTEFREIAKSDSGIECYFTTANSLGRKIHQIQPELQRLFGLEVIPGKGGEPASYRFTKKRPEG